MSLSHDVWVVTLPPPEVLEFFDGRAGVGSSFMCRWFGGKTRELYWLGIRMRERGRARREMIMCIEHYEKGNGDNCSILGGTSYWVPSVGP